MAYNEISTEQGSIYFIRERNLITKELSPFVKIGLTGLHRKATNRKNDLQTGNPRELFVEHEVMVPCVRAIETALRYRFLEQNVNLEWHIFSESSKYQIQDALEYCEKLKSQFAEHSSFIDEAKRLDKTPSKGIPIPPSEEALYWRNEVLLRHEIVKLGQIAAAAQRTKAKECFHSGDQIPAGVKIIERQISEIDWKNFRKAYPDIVNNYIKCRLSGVFKVISKKAQNKTKTALRILHAEYETSKFFELFFAEENFADYSLELRQQQIKIQQLTKLSHIEKEIALCHLKVICGTAPGITNICSWVRELSPPRLDTRALKEEHRALLIPFTSSRKLVTTVLKRSAGEIAENLLSKNP